jgi:hypothetical protein
VSRFGVFKINGTDYDLDDLTLDEVENIEELCGGVAFSELNFGSAKAMKAVSFTLLRRNDPDLKPEDVGSVRMIDMLPADEETPPLPPPVEGDQQNGSALDASGHQPSPASTSG